MSKEQLHTIAARLVKAANAVIRPLGGKAGIIAELKRNKIVLTITFYSSQEGDK
jgi:hypothetical protein